MMAGHTELQSLKEEERVLANIAGKLGDQLNRLKVEELALISRIREEQEAAQSDSHSNGGRISTLQVEEEEIHDAQLQLDLDAANKNILVDQDEEEEEEESEEEQDELMAFMTQLEEQQKKNG